jgi:hypothetical protein
MMPGGDAEAYKYLQGIVEKVAAQTDDGACVTYIGKGGSGEPLGVREGPGPLLGLSEPLWRWIGRGRMTSFVGVDYSLSC